jgi:putative ABC transport system substrate-binding protein
VDALYTGNDNSIASAMSTYIDAAYEYGIPVYCGADSMVADGGFATIGVDYVQLGNQVADIVIRLAKGEMPEDIPYETLSDYARFVNLQAADTLGMKISDEILSAYRVLVEADGTSHFGE